MYSCRNGRIVSPCVRVVWELNPVGKGDGGTLFMSGSHKSAFEVPEARRDVCDELFEDYGCPAGSVVIFSEHVRHSGTAWTNPDHDRVTIFNHYMHHGMRFHKGTAPHETVLEMPAKRRTLFRGVWVAAFPAGKAIPNDFYAEDNRAL